MKPVSRMTVTRAPAFGVRANLAQFSLLVAVNALVGGMLGQERTVLPLLAERVFHLAAYTSALTFIGAFALAALATGYIAAHAGLRPEPFFLGLAFAGLGLGLSTIAVRETHEHARHEARHHQSVAGGRKSNVGTRGVVLLASLRDRSLSAACQAGLVNNLNDGLAWGLFPLLFAQHGLTVAKIGMLAALYPAVWG